MSLPSVLLLILALVSFFFIRARMVPVRLVETGSRGKEDVPALVCLLSALAGWAALSCGHSLVPEVGLAEEWSNKETRSL